MSTTPTRVNQSRPQNKDTMTSPLENLINIIAKAASDKLATNPVAVEVGNRLALAEVFVIASAPTDRQVRAIAENIMDEVAKELHERPLRIEGRTEGRWILMDYGDVVVHILIDEDREYYALESLWGDAPVRQLDPEAVR